MRLKEDLLKKSKLLLQHFIKINFLTAFHADQASIQYGEFLKNDMKLVNKDNDIDCLDNFFTKLDVGKKCRTLNYLLIIQIYYHSHS